MTDRRSETWDRQRRLVAQRARDLAFRFGGEGQAVALTRIAEKCGIHKVVFRPLLVPGGLAADGNALVMFVKCDLEDADQYRDRFEHHGGIGLPTRMRFTIAHEIVHTFFLDLSQGSPVSRIKGKHPAELGALERACDYGAGILLLPPERMEQCFASDAFLEPHSITSWAERFDVSIEAFVNRLDEIPTWHNERGAVAVVRIEDTGPRITSLAIDNFSKPLFCHARETRNPRDLAHAVDLTMYGGSLLETEVELLGVSGGHQVPVRCAVACKQFRTKPVSYLLTIRLCK